MSNSISRRPAHLLAAALFAMSAVAAQAGAMCDNALTRAIPARAAGAPGGSAVVEKVRTLGGSARDAVIAGEVLSGNVPGFLRRLTPVVLSGRAADGAAVEITLCVTPGYLAVGSDRDFVRVPLGLPAAAEIADRFDFLLPTTRMVDAIHRQATVVLAPSPMAPTSEMTSTAYFAQHSATIDRALPGKRSLSLLTAGQKKDLVLSMRLRQAPGRVAIYGWHRTNGRPIQPLSTVHGARYADYSHGVRLVSRTAYIDGQPRALEDVMQDKRLAHLVSSEGPISNARGLLASLYR
ncbi:hypothetical protein Ga0609869_002686 [Rhodovulum iodosum]|uniref:Uncharacterized protein n=1 Tax=Rhodovulum iodosum TaxID=68291 RepID=A0ABV3XVG3_9RHOB|nr:hypothetical protein [Rhodovulum robiginosum]RSK33493.1 hypothetical protein EJA01_09355 [Rhodovulum robiginosum]